MEISNGTEARDCAQHGTFDAKVISILGREFASMCPGCSAEQQAQDADKLARKQDYDRRQAEDAQCRRIEALFQRAGIPPRFQDRTLDNYTATEEGQARALRIARMYVEMWPEMQDKGTSLIFSGKFGTGKSHLACAIANAVMATGSSALSTTVSDALRSIKRAYDKGSELSEADAINTLVQPRLLVLDECGMDYGTEHSKTLIFDVLNKRYEELRPTLILTNLDAPALREYFGDRVVDRLREGGGKLVNFNWDSHRI